MALAPPIIDFSPFYGQDPAAKSHLVEEIHNACLEFGFFQLRNHQIPADLQRELLRQCESLFNLPPEVKEKYDKDIGGFNRGYERLRAQNFEKDAKGDLKEGFYLGRNLALDDPLLQARKFGLGVNKYPEEVDDPPLFRTTMDDSHHAVAQLATDVLKVLLETLGVGDGFLDQFCDHPDAALRLLHYPPQAPDASEAERGKTVNL